jgi:hypothetical protein
MRNTLNIFITLFIFSCNWTDTHEHPDVSAHRSFRILLPDNIKTGRPTTTFNSLKIRAEQMKLPPLDKGVKWFELRMWRTGNFNPNPLIVIRKTDSSVIANKYYYYLINDTVAKFEIDNKRIKQPANLLLDSLLQLDFKKMVSQQEIEGFVDNVADGVTYHLEVSTNNYYKLVTYHCPETFAKNEVNNKQFTDLIFLLNRHIPFYSPYCKS